VRVVLKYRECDNSGGRLCLNHLIILIRLSLALELIVEFGRAGVLFLIFMLMFGGYFIRSLKYEGLKLLEQYHFLSDAIHFKAHFLILQPQSLLYSQTFTQLIVVFIHSEHHSIKNFCWETQTFHQFVLTLRFPLLHCFLHSLHHL